MILKISDRVKLVLNEGGFTFCNCVYIDDDVKAVIDTGADKKSIERIKPETIDLVLNTHHHYDHTRGNTYFCNARKLIHSKDFGAFESIDEFIHHNSLNRWEEIMPGFDPIEGIKAMGIPQEAVDLPGVDETFEDLDVIDFGNTKVEIFHTPGHSAGHCSFWFPDEEFLFTADICLTQAGPWYGEEFADPDEMIESIERLIKIKPPRLASSHINHICDDGVSRLIEFKNRIYKRDERIYNFIRQEPASIDQMADNHLIYKFHPTSFVLFWEKLMLLKHIKRLERAGMVEEVEPRLYKSI